MCYLPCIDRQRKDSCSLWVRRRKSYNSNNDVASRRARRGQCFGRNAAARPPRRSRDTRNERINADAATTDEGQRAVEGDAGDGWQVNVESHESRSRRHLPRQRARDPIDTISLVGRRLDWPRDAVVWPPAGQPQRRGRSHNSLRAADDAKTVTGRPEPAELGRRWRSMRTSGRARLTRNLADRIAASVAGMSWINDLTHVRHKSARFLPFQSSSPNPIGIVFAKMESFPAIYQTHTTQHALFRWTYVDKGRAMSYIVSCSLAPCGTNTSTNRPYVELLNAIISVSNHKTHNSRAQFTYIFTCIPTRWYQYILNIIMRWRFGLVVTRWLRSTQLRYVRHG